MLLQTTDSFPYLTTSPHSKYITLPWSRDKRYDLHQSLGGQTNNILPWGLPFVSNTITLPAFLYLSSWTRVIYSFSSSLVYFTSSLIHSLSFCTDHLTKVPKLSYHTLWTSINCQSSLISSNLVSMATKKNHRKSYKKVPPYWRLKYAAGSLTMQNAFKQPRRWCPLNTKSLFININRTKGIYF